MWRKSYKDGFEEMIAKESGVEKEDILSYDLFLYNRMRGTTLGINEEFVAAPKLDDLECAYSSIEGMLNAKLSEDYVTVCAVFDNEEVGSGTKQGAGSTFFPEVLKRISYLCGKMKKNIIWRWQTALCYLQITLMQFIRTIRIRQTLRTVRISMKELY